MKKTWHSHFQIAILVVSTLGLIAYTLFYPSAEELLGSKPQKEGKKVEVLASVELDKVKKLIANPDDWVMSSKHKLFISDKYLYFPEKNVVERETEGTQVGPFPLGWLQKYDLPILDLAVATGDPDGDGFTNIMEYNAADPSKGTNPIDPQSHPLFITRLRTKEVKLSKVEYKFTTAQEMEGHDVYSAIVETEAGRRSFMKQKGEKIEGFEILGYTPKKEMQKNASTGSEENVDVSELEVESKDLEMKTVFVLGQAKNIPEISVTFVLALVDKVQQPIKVERGKVFDIMGEKYRLLDASNAGVKVKRIDNNQEFLVPALTADDLRLLPQPPPKTDKK